MDRVTVIPEMIKNGESSRIIESESGYKVVLRPSVIKNSLAGKLHCEDVGLGMNIVNRQIGFSNINTGLYGQCCNMTCIAKDKCIFRALPNGNTNASVMFINKMPTDYEMATMTSHSDTVGVFLSLILSKMHISRDSVYCTDMIKCNTQLDEQSFNECIKTYLNKEIEYVAPKIIVCNGLSVLKACAKSGVLNGLPSDVTYGKIYEVNTALNLPVKVMAMYDLSTVLQKSGSEYERCKTELWTQILSAFKTLT